jgi:small subunit ribosomal protein S1
MLCSSGGKCLKITVAESAGFCFGVNKAVSRLCNLIDNNDNVNVYTLGPIIHNEQVVDYFHSQGVNVINSVKEAEEASKVVIRTHGVTPEHYEEMKDNNIEIIDATCPYVKKIHNLVRKKFAEGYKIIIAGDKSHPEVIGINGWCNNTAIIIGDAKEVEELPESSDPFCVVAQTTLTKEKWDSIVKNLSKKYKKLDKFDTICNATSTRQEEAKEIAKISDMMIVIGSKRSSNTQKLYEISKKYCDNTISIEKFGDLPPIDITKINTLGITAGASTPDWIIKEVIGKMDELNKQENDMTFSEAFEESLVTLRNGEIVKGKILSFNDSEVFVDLGYKSDGIIPMSEYTDDPDFNPETDLNVGDEIDVYIVRVNDGEGNVQLSKKKVDEEKGLKYVEEAYNNETPIEVKVTSVTKGGVIANAKGVRVFIPASQLGDRFVKDLSDYLGKVITIKMIEFNKQRRKIVGSQRVILTAQKQKARQEFWESVEKGKVYTGTVKNLMDFGAFVDIGGIDGLVHISELSWTKIKHPSEVLNTGDEVEVTVIDFDQEKNRVSLGYRKTEDNPWVKAAEKYKTGDVVKGTVVRLVPFGAFVELDEGVDGLVHISQISNYRLAKPGDVLEVGQEVEAKVLDFDSEAKKISLSIKEVNPIDPERPAIEEKKPEPVKEKPKKAAPAAAPTKHVEELTNTIGEALMKAKEAAEEAAKEPTE